ncbi:MAG: COG4315 family predicted lipoprotein [Gaiellaceae bacterium]
MRRLTLTLAGLAAVLSLGLSSAWASSGAATAAPRIAAASSSLGRILVDGRGHTLYLFAKDKGGKSACAGQCAGFWPPLIASAKPVAAAGAKTSLLGTTKRPDGRLQVTYNHHPLYTFVKDAQRGQTTGEELDAFGAEWYAVSPAGAKVQKSQTMGASNGDPASSGYGSGNGY